MKKNNHIFRLAVPVAFAATALLTTACTEMDDFFGNNSGKEVKFTVVEESDWNRTRGTEASDIKILDPVKVETPDGSPLYLHTYISNTIHNDNDATTRGAAITASNLEEFRVIGYKYDKSETYGDQSAFIEATATKSGTTFTLEKKLYWPGDDDRFTFCAYAPYVEREDSWSAPWVYVSDNTAKPQLAVTLSNYTYSNTGAPDLVVAEAKDQTATLTGENGVALSFTHPMTAIRFVVGDMGEADVSISQIQFQNVKYSGTYTIGEGWTTVNSGTTSFSFSPNSAKSVQDDDKNINTDETTLYMIPQEFTSDNSKISINLICGNRSVTLTTSLNGQQWLEGQTITYSLSTSAFDSYIIKSQYDFGSTNLTLYENGTKVNHVFNDENNAFGVVFIDSDGKVYASNVRYIYDAETKTFTTTEEVPVVNRTMYAFMYYPYKETNEVEGFPSVGDIVELPNSNINDLSIVFQSLAEHWPVHNNGTYQGLLNSALLTNYATLNNAVTLRVNSNDWRNQNPILAVSLGTKSVRTNADAKVIVSLDNDPSYQWTNYDNPVYENKQASAEFPADCIPFYASANASSTKYYYYAINRSVATELTSSSDCDYPWAETFTESDYNKRFSAVIYTNYGFEPTTTRNETYTIQVGDMFFADGGLHHDKNDYSVRSHSTPYGFVMYVDDPSTSADDEYTETGTVIDGKTVGGHALVMCNKIWDDVFGVNFPSTVQWLTNNSDELVDGMGSATTITQMTQPGMISGYQNTLKGLQAYEPLSINRNDAFHYAGVYNNQSKCPLKTDKTTGWFLPSAAQVSSLYRKNAVGDYAAYALAENIPSESDYEFQFQNQYLSADKPFAKIFENCWYNVYNGSLVFEMNVIAKSQAYATCTQYDASNYIAYLITTGGAYNTRSANYGFVLYYRPKTTKSYAHIPFLAF